ncbi:Coiled-coil domain-containing protein 130 [Geodia barretti]|nr:Coiled-coil domain-containing protein 130 [Geodia barretti]
MGVRYNAEKTRAGSYYSTPIFKFRMKCHLCDNHFEIQTDPKNMAYVVVSGASRKNERWEEKEGETVSVEGHSEAQKLASDAMYRLEHGVEDKTKADEAAPRIARIMAMNDEKLEDFGLNQLIRKKFRGEKKALKAKADADEEIQKRASISIPLVEEKKEDIVRARATEFAAGTSLAERKRRRREIKSQSVFGDGSKMAKVTVLKTGAKLDGSIFSRGRHERSTGGASSGSVDQHRQLLGIKTSSSSKTSKS